MPPTTPYPPCSWSADGTHPLVTDLTKAPPACGQPTYGDTAMTTSSHGLQPPLVLPICPQHRDLALRAGWSVGHSSTAPTIIIGPPEPAPAKLPPDRGLVQPMLLGLTVGVAVGLAIGSEALDAWRSWRHGRRVRAAAVRWSRPPRP